MKNKKPKPGNQIVRMMLMAIPVFLLLSFQVAAQDVVVSGRVVNADNQPLSGVSVSVRGSTKGVITNTNGEFSITAKRGDVISFSSVNLGSQEIVADRDVTLNIV
jgi:hypothetical protein